MCCQFMKLIINIHEIITKPQGLLINFNTTNITKSMKPLNEYFKRLDTI
jgi:hypothetical protein